MAQQRFYQGPWDFIDFQMYQNRWIITNVLPDLETVFEGARERWENINRPEDGRGDFILATALFALLDHLGTFLAKPGEIPENRLNISRCAELLPSTSDVYYIVATFGRNALVHGAWPLTHGIIGDYRLGLNITANPDKSDHRKLYWRRYRLPSDIDTTDV